MRKIILAQVFSLSRRPTRKMQSLADVYMTSGRERENTKHLSSPQVEPNTVMLFPFHLIKS